MGNVIDFFSKKVLNKKEGEEQPGTPENQEGQGASIHKLTPKHLKDIEDLQNKSREVFMRRSLCTFNKMTNPNGCNCQYCVFTKMLSQRLYDILINEVVFQSKKGTMIFSTADMVEIIEGILQKVTTPPSPNSVPPPPPPTGPSPA